MVGRPVHDAEMHRLTGDPSSGTSGLLPHMIGSRLHAYSFFLSSLAHPPLLYSIFFCFTSLSNLHRNSSLSTSFPTSPSVFSSDPRIDGHLSPWQGNIAVSMATPVYALSKRQSLYSRWSHGATLFYGIGVPGPDSGPQILRSEDMEPRTSRPNACLLIGYTDYTTYLLHKDSPAFFLKTFQWQGILLSNRTLRVGDFHSYAFAVGVWYPTRGVDRGLAFNVPTSRMLAFCTNFTLLFLQARLFL